MPKSFITAVLCLFTLAATVRADDLFSTVPLGSPFADAKANAKAGGGLSEKGQRLLSSDHLAELLRDAQLSPKTESDELVSLKFKHQKWDFPVAFTLTDNNTRLWITFVLAKFEGEKKMDANQMVGLLAANRDLRPAFFAVADSGKRLELYLALPNEQISPKVLRDNLQNVASVAENTAQLWDLAGGPAANSAPNQQPPADLPVAKNNPPAGKQVAQSPATPAPVPTTAPLVDKTPPTPSVAPGGQKLLGKWAAAIGEKEALALLLNADSTFTIVHVKDGKSTKSSGKFTVANGLLTMNGSDGVKFAGKIANILDKSFDFTPQGSSNAAAKMVFKKAG